ncbi:T-cell surface glycoprotein CD8 beta chain-like [Hemibagrus wyckioides]|uniref:T-cell surface glycoprotein CD8 beta chain-like n=1 Tax=Hemibagrus wyckioides TaxID=337641 RepID=UPI00266BF858|nr:T-cell surface glycoprotein CD8 beta chain-like [Hemibagrus wyckioides]XP_058235406.1 T-cell surface glycoprotein CD8 beta chain-like [Hemibagrus wyckioides]
MTTLFVALCVLFSLFTAVNSSDIKELHVRTVKSGEDVTMECNISSVTGKDKVVWFRQSSGKLPQYFARPYQVNSGYKFVEGFNDSRFSISVNDHKFDLNINKIREDDVGEYFCGEMEGPELKFTSGTRLQFEDKETTHRPTSGSTTENSTSSDDEGESCTANMRVFFWLSISRIGVLCVTVIILTICHKVLKSKSYT